MAAGPAVEEARPMPPRTGDLETDGQLLERYARLGEERAFTALVHRHGPVVRGVCRRVLHHEQDAEDVSQGAFLVLARKAGLIAWQSSVRNWLCATAYRLALHTCTATQRQQQCERPFDDLTEEPTGHDGGAEVEAARRELRSVVRDELHRLPEKYRAPVVLCYLEGKTNEEAARLLGWPAGSMSRRLARARLLLQERLTRRGLALALLLIWMTAASLWAFRHSSLSPVLSARLSSHHGLNAVGLQAALHRVAEGESVPGKGDLLELLDQAQRMASALRDHDAGPRRLEWTASADEMQQAVLVLAAVVRADREERSVPAAARRLSNSCKQCHEMFRQ